MWGTEKRGLSDYFPANWRRDDSFCPPPLAWEGEGRRGFVWSLEKLNQSRDRRTSSTEDCRGEDGDWMLTGWWVPLSNPILFQNTGTLMNPHPVFPAEIRGSLYEEKEPAEKIPWWGQLACMLIGCLPTEIPMSLFLNFLNIQSKNFLAFEGSHDRDEKRK